MKWEYKTVKLSKSIDNNADILDNSFDLNKLDVFINKFGNQEWELVSTQGIIPREFSGQTYTKEILLFFKRPLAE